MKRLVSTYLSVMSLAVAVAAQASGPVAHEVAPSEAMARLGAGNQRFVKSASHSRARAGLVHGQHPFAIVLTCADSRVSPEIVFDEQLGQLFVVRVAGNVVDPIVLGSIEYAVEHLHAHLLVVLGHDGCGAVGAAISSGALPPDIAAITHCIDPAVNIAKGKGLNEAGTLAAAVRENVLIQCKQATAESGTMADLVAHQELTIKPAVYHLDSGKVEWLTEGQQGDQK